MNDHHQADLTPLMKQYFRIKAEFHDSIVLFQVGDFYELFFDDAKTASAFLGIALTKRGKISGEPIPLCGVPLHALDHYLVKLVRGGFKVAIADQLEEATPGKVVERGVTRVLTPGTLTDAKLLDEKTASYLFSFFPLEHEWGLVFGELLTGQLFATSVNANNQRVIESEMVRFFPDEVLIPDNAPANEFVSHFKKMGYYTTLVSSTEQSIQETQSWIENNLSSAKADLAGSRAIECALATFYAYLSKNQKAALDQFKSIHFYQPEDFLVLDAATTRNLELIANSQDGTRKNSLLSILDRAVTPMGSRMIKKWLMRPLVKKEAIFQRQDAIESFISDITVAQKLNALLSQIGDLERVIGRIALARASFNDYGALKNALQVIPEIKHLLMNKSSTTLLYIINSHIEDLSQTYLMLSRALNDDSSREWVIKSGFDERLDAMRDLVENAHQKIIQLEQDEQRKTGINSLKIRYNQVHGYYIEITKANLDAVPDYYKRQQTLVGKERYMIPGLYELQHEITTARNQIAHVEKDIFDSIKREVARHIGALRKMAHAYAHLDALLSFANLASDNGYVRPVFNDQRAISIKAGRHPVIEQQLRHRFIANDLLLNDEQSLIIITGPNMGGKSTFLRQTALIALMAHIGSFVPAQAANIALLDRIFTRIGAGDSLAEGKSTFLVEMEETAAICSHATERSLVILDEVGRGTSTFDGLAIAQAVVEYLYAQVRARCLFATHYHELAHLQDQFPGIASYFAASKKNKEGILFLYTMVRGIADGSFGLEVAKLADLPTQIVERAQDILESINQSDSGAVLRQQSSPSSLHDEDIQIYEELRKAHHTIKQLQERLLILDGIDYDHLSPKKAFDILWHIKD